MSGEWRRSGGSAFRHLEDAGVAYQRERRYALRYLGDPRYTGKARSKAMRIVEGLFGDGEGTVAAAAIGAWASLCTEDEFWQRMEADRKRPWRLASRIGPASLALYALGRLDLEGAMRQIEGTARNMGITVEG